MLPALRDAFTSAGAFAGKVRAVSRSRSGMLRETMLGTICFVLAIAAFVALAVVATRSRTRCSGAGWPADSLYVFVVVTVERVDYYMYPLLPLCALAIGGALARIRSHAFATSTPRRPRATRCWRSFRSSASSRSLERRARRSLRTIATTRRPIAMRSRSTAPLPPDALVVIGHYGPDVQYYIDRFGWEEDPRAVDAVRRRERDPKGARYFISIEDGRLRRNLELCAWLQRFPMRRLRTRRGPVYETDPQRNRPGADAFWRAFRSAERAGTRRAFLDAAGVCTLTARPRLRSDRVEVERL